MVGKFTAGAIFYRKIHSNSESGAGQMKSCDDKDTTGERDLFIATCEKLEVPINPTHDGFFAWLEHDNPAKIVESCAQEQVYLVP